MSDTQGIYEQTLVVRSQIGDELAFEELLTLHGPHLFTVYSDKSLFSRQHPVSTG